jgi:hypothetical protein
MDPSRRKLFEVMQEHRAKGTVMSKSKVMFTLGGFVLAAAMALPAQGAPKKKKACPNNWDRVKVSQAECEDEARKIDEWGNDDNFVCERARPGNLKYRDNKDKDNDWDDDRDDDDDDDDDND